MQGSKGRWNSHKWSSFNLQYNSLKNLYNNSGLDNLKIDDRTCNYIKFNEKYNYSETSRQVIASGDYGGYLNIAVKDKKVTGVYHANNYQYDNVLKYNCSFFIQGIIDDSGEADIIVYKQPSVGLVQNFIKGRMYASDTINIEYADTNNGINIKLDSVPMGCNNTVFQAGETVGYGDKYKDVENWQEIRIYAKEKDFLYEEPEEDKKSDNYYLEYGDILYVVDIKDNWLKVINDNPEVEIKGWIKEEDLFPLKETQETEYLEKDGIKYPVSKYEGTDELFENEKYKVKITQEYLKTGLDQGYSSLLDDKSKDYIEEQKGGKENFGGKYLVVYWGCGTECSSGSLINLENGKMHTLPTAEWGMKFNEESLIYIANPLEEDKDKANKYRPKYAYPRYYYFNEEKERFELLCNAGEVFGNERERKLGKIL